MKNVFMNQAVTCRSQASPRLIALYWKAQTAAEFCAGQVRSERI